MLFRNATTIKRNKHAIYKYFNESTFSMKYLIGAIEESDSVVFVIILRILFIIYNPYPIKSNTAISVVIDVNTVV